MQRGLLEGLKSTSLVPPWMGGGDSKNDGRVVCADSTAEGDVRLAGQFDTHRCSLYQAGAQTIPNAVWTSLIMNTTNYDPTKGMINGVWIVPAAGSYLVVGSVALNAFATQGNFGVGIGKTNALHRQGFFGLGWTTTATEASASAIVTCALGDWVQMMVYQASGAGVSVLTGASVTWMDVQRLT